MRIIVAGSNGYFGKILVDYLRAKGNEILCVDKTAPTREISKEYIQCDLSKDSLSSKIPVAVTIDAVIDLATEIDFAVNDQDALYRNNAKCVKNLLSFCKERSIKRYVYTSSNSIYLGNRTNPISEKETPIPIDEYGKSKWDSEIFLRKHSEDVFVNIIRCPNIVDAGRVGMLSILFELLEANSTLWVVGNGQIKHQCIYAQDLCCAIEKFLFYQGSATVNIGSDNVPFFSEMFHDLATYVGSKSKIRGLPKWLVIPLMKVLYKLGLSPMGPYQFRMLTREFVFDTSEIKRVLNWAPTLDNAEMFRLAYDHYISNKKSMI